MKLLLTSNGLSNHSIAESLFELVGKTPEETTIVFIPTASNIEIGDKCWFINDLINLKKYNFHSIEITDISAVGEEIWRPSLERADVLFFEGGNTYHLMRWIKKIGLDHTLPSLLNDKVYVGVSAGSMITNPDLNLKLSHIVYDEDRQEIKYMSGLGLVDFYFLPHLNSDSFTKMREKNIEQVAESVDRVVYAVDDASALRIVDDQVAVIGEGEYLIYGNTDNV